MSIEPESGPEAAGRHERFPRRISDPTIAAAYFLAAVCGLALVLVAGMLASRYYAVGTDLAGFSRLRAVHGAFAAGWILTAAHGFVLACLSAATGARLWSRRLAFVQLGIWICSGVAIIVTTQLEIKSGREYLNFPPWVSGGILLGAIMTVVNYFATVRRAPRPVPIYVWMWGAGALLFLWTFVEANLWLIPFYGRTLVRDMTVQWKSYGALVGSWNLMIYGLTFYCLDRLTGGLTARIHRLWRAVSWLALANALFAWAHHTYQLPQAKTIRWVAFLMSMTEILLLIKVIYDASSGGVGSLAGKIFRAGGFWAVANLLLSLVISVPHLNGITHGTQVTVAHAMGSTIGIHLLLLGGVAATLAGRHARPGFVRIGIALFHPSLALFLIGLTWMGLARGTLQLRGEWSWLLDFETTRTARWMFVGAGIALFVAILLIMLPLVNAVVARGRARSQRDLPPGRPCPPRLGLSAATALAILLFGGAGLALWYSGRSQVRAAEGDDVGRRLFRRNCLSCHGLRGEGTAKAPALRGKNFPVEYAWLFVKVGARKMPAIPGLDRSEVEAILRYLQSDAPPLPGGSASRVRIP